MLSVGCISVDTCFLYLPVISKLQSNLQSYQFHGNYYFEKDLSLNTMKKMFTILSFYVVGVGLLRAQYPKSKSKVLQVVSTTVNSQDQTYKCLNKPKEHTQNAEWNGNRPEIDKT